MRHIGTRLGALLGLGLLAAAPAVAQAQTAPDLTGHVRVGTLRCDVAAGTSFIFGSTRDVHCVFTPTNGATERYTGEISRYGVDIGFTGAAVMLWGVMASTGDVRPGALGGTFAGVSAAATAGVGGAANILVGGSNRGIALQPLSVEGNTGLNIALGVGELKLTAAR
ncbi:DUF992 domain-containing protein [Roseomonas terrae]|jgi:hypothetical protein|uniref:DUF992 domain-containing protein n=1 Tax=Neoroseomonas terrae TaxID=424799 RepID=A0ABS5EQR7_9PROT|nr:DUF992 domain-containing protein [Neoroseomonas terrae]MBR0652962.1 DUF992 domain-containing protein [Neoroseomonas terrae]